MTALSRDQAITGGDVAAPAASQAGTREASGVPEGVGRLEARSLSKIFTDNPGPALELLDKGASKDEVLEKLDVVAGVYDASFTVEPGEIFVVMGLSGSGKSTLIRLLNRLIEPSAGELLLAGRDIVTMNKRDLLEVRRKHMSMVFQSFALMPHLTALDNAAFGQTIAGISRDERRRAARAVLEQVGLGSYAERFPHEMSGGMQQRVGLARALCSNPSILLMDEAFSALDPLIRTEMQDELLRLQREHRRTVIFISHDLDEAMRIGDRIAIMEGGRIVQVGTPLEILRNPADDYVRSFFRNVDVSKVLRAGVAAGEEKLPLLKPGKPASEFLNELRGTGDDFGQVIDNDGLWLGLVSVQSLEAAGGQGVEAAFLPGVSPIADDKRLIEILGDVAAQSHPVPVVADDGRYVGSLTCPGLLKVLDRTA
ncbi:glycine betaine/L-proline ABC transporter ATP-binding protein ProV [Marinivivus vitaminiproducens]|uniref:glycine betaine/L-proline ABC transporter ATP-binding protein ProV n=1 Tax=Marinivivus vitaminiproducens TaxID=3035935 RepID=UPI0027A7E150|nr:glycine betaine/L-proline ABC transporter ATP-binding protein ProV [Geminicoccaceae bacterium SCSIO 64248]